MTQDEPPIPSNKSILSWEEHQALVNRRPSRRISLSGLKGRIPAELQASIGAATRRSAKITGLCFGGFAAIALLGGAGLYARLYQGPIQMDFLLPAIEKAVSGQIPDSTLDIRGAVIRLGENKRSIEFRLTDVSVLDPDNKPVAQAPFASIGLSGTALLSGRVAAGQINLIGAKLVANYSEERGLALSFSEERQAPPAARQASAQTPQPRVLPVEPGFTPEREAKAEAAPVALPDARGQINLVQVLTALFEQTRQSGSATSYLTQFGIKDATVYYDHGDRLTRWSVPEASVELSHLKKRSVISGAVSVETPEKPWRLEFRAEQKLKNNSIDLSASIAGVTPRALAEEFPSFAALSAFNMPVTISARADMAENGDITSATLGADIGKGELYAPWDKKHPAGIDAGAFRIAYSKAGNKIELLPSFIAWDESRIELAGSALRSAQAGGGHSWAFDIHGPEVTLGSAALDIPAIRIDELIARGDYDPAAQAVNLDAFLLRAADASVQFSGRLGASPQSGGVDLQGAFSPMPLSFVKLIWPKFVAAGAREWSGKNISGGRLTGGAFKALLPPALIEDLRKGGDVPAEAASLRLDLDGVVMNYIKGMPPMRTARATASLAGRRFTFDAPGDAAINLPSGAKLSLSGQFLVADLRQRVPNGEIHFKASGDVGAVEELLDHEPLGYVGKAGLKPGLIAGKTSASFSLGMPMIKDLAFKDMTLRGKARAEDLRATGLEGGLGIHGGAMTFDVSEKALEAQGEIKVNGVPVQVAGQRIFDAPLELQPRLRLKAVLSEKARDNLGLSLNHIVKGEIQAGVEVALRRDAPPDVSVEADLTNADLLFANAGWRKPPGQRAIMSFNAEKTPDGGVKLNGLKILGDQLSVNGALAFNAEKKLAAFEFPKLSLNALTDLELSGALTPQNIWKIQAKGASYDGRQFFRSLFSAGQLAENQPAPSKGEPGVDIHAELSTVIGYYDSSVKNVVIDARKRGGKLTALEISGRLNGVSPLAVRLDQRPGQPRLLLAEATDAGAAFRAVGFYPALRGGEASLKVNLDAAGAAEKEGTLYVTNFSVTGDQVFNQVVTQGTEKAAPGARRSAGQRRQAAAEPQSEMQFDRMTVPFQVGHGQFVLKDSAINGPLLGATIRGRIDLARETISLSGTYVPLYGLNSIFSPVPIIGDLLSGPRGEGIFGITFAVQGSTKNPDVIVNPMSLITPGFLRGIMEFDHTPPRVIPRTGAAPSPQTRSSSQPAVAR